MDVGCMRRRRRCGLSARSRKRPRRERDTSSNVSNLPIPAIPSDVWSMIVRGCDLSTKAVVAQVCRAASLGVAHMPNLQLARNTKPDITRSSAVPFARTLRTLAELLAVAPCIGVGGAASALRDMAGEGGYGCAGFVSLETVRFFLGLTAGDLPHGIPARSVAMPRSKCCVQHKGPSLEHAPGYRVECALVYPLSYVLHALVEKRGVQGVEDAIADARVAVDVLEKRKAKGVQARKVVDETLAAAGLKDEDVAYIVGLEAVQDALFGLDHPGLVDTLRRAVAVHKAIRPRYLWLWTNDGKARRKATLFLKKGIARRMNTGELVRYIEGKFWWATHHIASMPAHMRVAEEKAFGPFEPVSPAYSSASSGAESGLRIPPNEMGANWDGLGPAVVIEHVTGVAPLNEHGV